MDRYQKRFHAFILAVVFFYGMAAALSELAGDLPREVTADKSPYLVVADIFVPSGKAIRIEAGTVFLFKNFTGLHVQGVLSARGTAAHPIVFTSANDRSYPAAGSLNPTPYDWNGVYIMKDGMGTEMEHFNIRYSVKGIVSETKFINLAAGVFSENGRSHCTIEGVEQKVEAGVPFSHSVSLKDATVDGVPVKILKDPQAVKRNTVRYSGLTFLVGGVALGSIYGIGYHESQAAFDALKSRDTSNTIWNVNGDYLAAREKRNRDRAGTVLGTILALAGSAGFFWTFTF